MAVHGGRLDCQGSDATLWGLALGRRSGLIWRYTVHTGVQDPGLAEARGGLQGGSLLWILSVCLSLPLFVMEEKKVFLKKSGTSTWPSG